MNDGSGCHNCRSLGVFVMLTQGKDAIGHNKPVIFVLIKVVLPTGVAASTFT